MTQDGPKEIWQIGNVSVTRVIETVTLIKPSYLYPDASLETLAGELNWLQPHFMDQEGKILLSIHSFLIESEGARIIVDTCVGNDKDIPMVGWKGLKTRFLDHLVRAGFPRESIDYVLCTHLHFDHVGWNTFQENGKWVPTFPNARYLVGAEEWGYWHDHPDQIVGNTNEEAILPIFEAKLVDLVPSDHKINNEVRLVPTPGHTPGHVSVEIVSNGAQAVITGDLFHHPLGFAHPDWKGIADVDGELAYQSRIEFMKKYGDNPVLVLGTHFASPTGGKLVSEAGVYRFEVE